MGGILINKTRSTPALYSDKLVVFDSSSPVITGPPDIVTRAYSLIQESQEIKTKDRVFYKCKSMFYVTWARTNAVHTSSLSIRAQNRILLW
jgi:hypothetical protein